MKLVGSMLPSLYGAMITGGITNKNNISGGAVSQNLIFDPASYLASSDIIDSDHPDIVAKAKSIADMVVPEITSEEDCDMKQQINQEELRKREIIRQTFEFVRDEILHSWDYGQGIVKMPNNDNEGNENNGNVTPPQIPITCKASDVLHHRTGYCYAKAHLLAALLRANGIPTGFCYQRLTIADDDGSPDGPYCLHGLNAVYLQELNNENAGGTTEHAQDPAPKKGYYWYRIDPRGLKPSIPKADFCPPKEALAFQVACEGEMDFQEVHVNPLPSVVETLQTWNTWEEVAENLPDMKK